ncbi:hypothetical protein Y032_0022g512 [Ancylostoma ceylanicum]|uniref:Uncharacterized protein n=1 Tax=Ancylostoma ceylanicum TaxID=53326 RepID=A0A016UYX8_9BILA|nr:hypothetical protein Y032_0022g512 [Ancylostoma ceylanicum]
MFGNKVLDLVEHGEEIRKRREMGLDVNTLRVISLLSWQMDRNPSALLCHSCFMCKCLQGGSITISRTGAPKLLCCAEEATSDIHSGQSRCVVGGPVRESSNFKWSSLY